jgi:hypothetical protein
MNRLKYGSAQIESRKEIIEESSNIDLLKGLLGSEIPIGLGDSPEYYTSQYISIPQYDETDRFGILYTSKGGSSIIRGLLEKYNLCGLNKFGTEDLIFLFRTLLSPKRDEKLIKESNTTLAEMLSGKSKKDLIVVTRNPLYKWLSGLFMDINGEVHRSKLLYTFIKEKHNLNNNEDPLYLSPEALGDITYMYLKTAQERGDKIGDGHAALYNETYYNLLINNTRTDLTKLKIIDIDDIDSDIFTLIKKYYPEIEHDNSTKSFWTMRGQHEAMLKGLMKNISENNDESLKSLIKQEILRDFYYYNLLKERFKKSIVK